MGLPTSFAERRKHELQVLQIVQIVCGHYKLKLNKVCGPTRRNTDIARARQVISYIARKTTMCSYTDIGRVLQYRDHTPAIHGTRRVMDRIRTDPEFAAEITLIKHMQGRR